jgi:hypothetical protein
LATDGTHATVNDAPAGAREQAHLEHAFEFVDAPRQRRLCNKEGCGCRAKT